MDLLSSAYTLGVGYIVPFLFVLTIVVFFHELGHFAVARWCNVKIDAFSVGFGRELFGFNDRKGTRWKLSLIPLGGYVKFAGDENAASTPDRDFLANMSEEERRTAFAAKPVWQRAAVVAAGPIANFLLAIVIFASIFAVNGKQIVLPVVGAVDPGTAAAEAGILPGDRILAVNGEPIQDYDQIRWIVRRNPDSPIVVVVDRDGQERSFTMTPVYVTDTDRFGNEYRSPRIGIRAVASAENVKLLKLSIPEAIVEGGKETYKILFETVSFIQGMITGAQSPKQLGGPIQIAHVSGEVAHDGIISLIWLAGLLSISIGFINLLPVPILDGGHLLYYALEAVRGKPLSERIQEAGFRFGIFFVLALMVFAAWNDIWRLVKLFGNET